MLHHQLGLQDSEAVLAKCSIGHMATISEDGYPYVIPVHYVHSDGKIYIHGASKGLKIDNINQNPRVSFEATLEEGLIQADEPCDTNTKFKSVVIKGEARTVENDSLKRKVLDLIVNKYTPQHSGKEFPSGAFDITGIIEIKILALTGKYYT
jgi:nitroimidazol reductase NimA-like FMN-containing flavoprotein (pyridoxamine 5'-phosphate oxidase superfamily)